MDTFLEKAQRDAAATFRSRLDSTVEGLKPGTPEYAAAFRKALEGIAATVPRKEYHRRMWDFEAEKGQAVFARDEVAILRPIQIADADFYVKVKAQYSMMYRALIRMGKVDNESLLKTDIIKPESFFCVVEDAKDGIPVGYLGIKDTRTDIWEIAIELDGQFTHKGFGSRSIWLFLNELYRITGRAEYLALVETDNRSSQKCFEKLGAKLVGLCNGPFLKLPDEKERFEDRNLNLIDDNMRELALRLDVEPRKLLSHVLEYRMTCQL